VIRSALFLTGDEVCVLFCHPGDKTWLWRHSGVGGFLQPATRRFGGGKTGRQVLFLRSEIARICGVEESSLDKMLEEHR
jgi:hypothetical protein